MLDGLSVGNGPLFGRALQETLTSHTGSWERAQSQETQQNTVSRPEIRARVIVPTRAACTCSPNVVS